MAQKTILVVDDDPHIRDVITFALEQSGMRPIEARDGAEALEIFGREDPDLVILDILMPGLDGLDVCRRIRMESQKPVLFLSSRDDEVDRVVGLELGGDDYVSKPFSPRELIARVKAILKRSNGGLDDSPAKADAVLTHGALRLDGERFAVSWDGAAVELTATEFNLLATLMRRPGHVTKRNALIDGAYGVNMHVSDRTIDSHVRNIRQKLAATGADGVIETVHGVGYRLGACS